jgi:hypothetical protein
MGIRVAGLPFGPGFRLEFFHQVYAGRAPDLIPTEAQGARPGMNQLSPYIHALGPGESRPEGCPSTGQYQVGGMAG